MARARHFWHNFRGRRYRVRVLPASAMPKATPCGVCDDPASEGKEMVLMGTGGERDVLDGFIHESLHACLWDLSEDAVGETAGAIARLLLKLGYRRGR